MKYVLLGAFLISFSSVFVNLADVGPTAAVFYRFLFATLTVGTFALVGGHALWKGVRPFVYALVAGIIFSFDLFFWHRCIHAVGPGLATILANFQVFSLAVIGVVFLRERLTWRLITALPLSIIGLMMIVGIDVGSLERGYLIGIGYGLLTAACYTALTLTLKKSQSIPNGLSAAANMAVVSAVGAVAAALEVHAVDEHFSVPNTFTWIMLIAYGAICSGIGWSVISRGLATLEASRAGLILILQPTLAFVWDIVFFARPTDIFDAIGACMTLLAIYLGAVSGKTERGFKD